MNITKNRRECWAGFHLHSAFDIISSIKEGLLSFHLDVLCGTPEPKSNALRVTHRGYKKLTGILEHSGHRPVLKKNALRLVGTDLFSKRMPYQYHDFLHKKKLIEFSDRL